MKLLIIRDQHQLACQIRDIADQRIEDIMPIPVSWEAIGESVDITRLIEQQQPDYIICAIYLDADATRTTQKRFKTVVELLERGSRKYGLPLVFLSSAAVFEGGKLGYEEGDKTSPKSELGQLYAEMETHISKRIRRHIILRTSWVFSTANDGFVGSVIEYAAENQLISFNSAGKGCPTSSEDIARVVIAMLLQIDLGAECWGTYHYASSDPAIGFQFTEAILAHASQYNEKIDIKALRFEHNDSPSGAFYFEPVVLQCQKLLDTFGIHQKPWRATLPAIVRQYFEWEPEEEC